MSAEESSRSASAETRRDAASSAAVKAGEEDVSPALDAAPAVPVSESGTWEQIKALGYYLTKTEVHTYAFSVAAQAILSLFPFIVLLLTISEHVFHSAKMTNVVSEMMTNFLPNNQAFVMRNMRLLATPHAKTRIVSIIMLLITATGIFLPLEVALNSVWGVKKNRSYIENQLVAIVLAAGVALLALASVALSAAQRTVLDWVFFGHTQNALFALIARGFLQIVALLASIALFFLIYWWLPHRKVPALAVLPTAVVMGLLWTAAKYAYIFALPHLDFAAVYGPFEVSVGLMVWAFISGLLLLGGAYVSATRHALREAREAELKPQS
ncbi:MAG TPA: YihY/virulence factor BrkB family protein [Candidatus Aquilonibacter sp.]|nr:YihY/virulence factor BrkB family protein [Candidatus Aquilonibacter sp.]